ncbi:two-component sensor histidine kinase [Bacillus toyonensis]|uniref:sensor histidine kinase n=1 Tax=Bacillus cereus group TaxID=86661 RepID=UPI000BEC7DE9|nr:MULTISPECIES: HAMP domain-containing histidine kinase [Bacillus cereus group]MBJ7932274.1 HAMP domain-containing protein [Bacillus cereus group sp. N31]PEG17782.1 two-component sensor histidine kinase [Bacillus toyonensis]PEM42049.1 two-component sensor histidine kinase [Bacillus toyonensis]QWH89140.1 HAMP domain-containing histidine kinase [Bacillus toyonensis]QWI32309.1 HAMP domain-containing histidine kinase [Bacillus toyonensis]
MIRNMMHRIRNLPIKWKLTLWSTTLVFILFILYSALQFIVINKWTIDYEQKQINRQVTEIAAYFQDKNDTISNKTFENSKDFLNNMIDKHQMIRIIGMDGKQIVTVSRDFNETWIKPKQVTQDELFIKRHLEDRILVKRIPIQAKGFTGTIELTKNLETFDHLLKIILVVMLIAGISGLVLSFLGGVLITKKLLSSVQNITDTMKRIKKNGLNERVPVRENNDELSKLSFLFNEMMDEVETSFTQQKQFVEDASHELRTPLTIIQGHLAMLNRWGKNDPAVLDKSLQASLKELDRLNKLVLELLELSRAESEQMHPIATEPVHVNSILKHVTQNFAVLQNDFQFDMKLSGDAAYVSMPSSYLEQIIIIILDNAVKYTKEVNKYICIESTLQSGEVKIRILDRGAGIPKVDLPFVLNRFYRVDKARSRKQGGNGLGLSIAKRLVEKYNGAIQIESKENEGTIVTIILPCIIK